jgi:hypothetical protein
VVGTGVPTQEGLPMSSTHTQSCCLLASTCWVSLEVNTYRPKGEAAGVISLKGVLELGVRKQFVGEW